MRLMFFPLVAALLVWSAAHADPSTGAKKADVTEARSTGAFTGIHVKSVIGVDLTIGKTTKVVLKGPADWLPRITTTVDHGVLVIDMPGKYKKIPELSVAITTPSLDAITISGVGNVDATGLTGDSLAVDVSGTGQLTLAGAVGAMTMDLSGAVEVEAKDLITKTTTLDISGTGNAEVHATKQIDVDISGVGAVTVYGKPAKVSKHITGTGAVDLDD